MTETPDRAPSPFIQGRCPACGGASLFVASGGYVTCSRLDCPEPDAASTPLEKRAPDDADEPAQCWRLEPHAPHVWTLSPDEGGVDCPGIPTAAERDMLGRETDRLRRGWIAMRDRAEDAEAGSATHRAINEEARDALDAAGANGAHGDDWPRLAPAIEALAKRAETAEATVERVRAECDRIEAAVRANPQNPDFEDRRLCTDPNLPWPFVCPGHPATDENRVRVNTPAPDGLRERYMAAIDTVTGGTCPMDIIDAVIAVRDEELLRLRAETATAGQLRAGVERERDRLQEEVNGWQRKASRSGVRLGRHEATLAALRKFAGEEVTARNGWQRDLTDLIDALAPTPEPTALTPEDPS